MVLRSRQGQGEVPARTRRSRGGPGDWRGGGGHAVTSHGWQLLGAEGGSAAHPGRGLARRELGNCRFIVRGGVGASGRPTSGPTGRGAEEPGSRGAEEPRS